VNARPIGSPTHIYSTDEGLVIKVELAGMRSENLQITVEGSQLRISGQRPDGCRGPKVSFLAMEINYGSLKIFWICRPVSISARPKLLI